MTLGFRRLVALDMTVHSARFILLEYSLGSTVLIIVGVLVALRISWWAGGYLFFLGLDYLPLLMLALSLRHDHERVGRMNDPEVPALIRKYMFQELWLFVPMAVPVICFAEYARRNRSGQI